MLRSGTAVFYKNSEVNPRTYGQIIFDKGNKNIKQEKDSFFSRWC